MNDVELQTKMPMNIVVSIVNTEEMLSISGFSFVLHNRPTIFKLFIFGENSPGFLQRSFIKIMKKLVYKYLIQISSSYFCIETKLHSWVIRL